MKDKYKVMFILFGIILLGIGSLFIVPYFLGEHWDLLLIFLLIIPFLIIRGIKLIAIVAIYFLTNYIYLKIIKKFELNLNRPKKILLIAVIVIILIGIFSGLGALINSQITYPMQQGGPNYREAIKASDNAEMTKLEIRCRSDWNSHSDEISPAKLRLTFEGINDEGNIIRMKSNDGIVNIQIYSVIAENDNYYRNNYSRGILIGNSSNKLSDFDLSDLRISPYTWHYNKLIDIEDLNHDALKSLTSDAFYKGHTNYGNPEPEVDLLRLWLEISFTDKNNKQFNQTLEYAGFGGTGANDARCDIATKR